MVTYQSCPLHTGKTVIGAILEQFQRAKHARGEYSCDGIRSLIGDHRVILPLNAIECTYLQLNTDITLEDLANATGKTWWKHEKWREDEIAALIEKARVKQEAV